MRIYQPEFDPAWPAGDNDTSLKPEQRYLMRAVIIDATDADGLPVLSNAARNFAVFRRALMLAATAPRTASGGAARGIGAAGFAVPVMVSGLKNQQILLRPMLGDGLLDPSLRGFDDAALPDGTREWLRGDAGVLIVGTDADRECRVFISDRARLMAHHRDDSPTELSTRVYDVDGDNRGLWAGLHRSTYVSFCPDTVRNSTFRSISSGWGVGYG